jgi:hypothetical protein
MARLMTARTLARVGFASDACTASMLNCERKASATSGKEKSASLSDDVHRMDSERTRSHGFGYLRVEARRSEAKRGAGGG